VSIQPAEVKIPVLSAHGVGHFQVIVTDAGVQPIKIQMETVRLGRTAACTQHSTPWLTVASRAYALQPGHSKTVAVTVDAQAGQNGNAAVIALASPDRAANGNFKIGGAVGSRFVLGNGSNALCTAEQPVITVKPHTSSGLPLALIIVLALVVVAVLAAGAFVLRKYVGRWT
jgi:hypothetical protein